MTATTTTTEIHMTETTETTRKTITITMSERRPLRIVDDEWPVIASARDWNGEHEFQANRIDTVRVREHADGRRIVTATHLAGGGGMRREEREIRAGFLVPASNEDAADGTKMPDEDETIRAIRRAAGVIGRDDLAAECIGDLPAEEI